MTQMNLSRAFLGFPGGSVGKESACNVGDLGSIPGLRRSPGGGSDNPLQYSCWRIPMDRGAWWAAVHVFTKSQTGLSNYAKGFFIPLLASSGYSPVLV